VVQVVVDLVSEMVWVLFHFVKLVLLGVNKFFLLQVNYALEGVSQLEPPGLIRQVSAIEHDLHVPDLLHDVYHVKVTL
jgi:hypothetical protein